MSFSKTLTLILLLLPFGLYSQNLVPNASFEEYTELPNYRHQLYKVVHWWNPIKTTPDYLHRNAPYDYYNPDIDNAHVYYNRWGTQLPRTGDGMIGLIQYSLKDTWNEYGMVKLLNKLEVGAEYDIEFFVSLGEKMKYASNGQGILFLTSETDPAFADSAIYTKPHAFYDSLIVDFKEWIPIRFKFIADLPYEYLVVGNFLEDSHPSFKIKDVGPPHGAYNGNFLSLYFWDDISVVKTDKKVDFTYQQEDICFPVSVKFEPDLLDQVEFDFWTIASDTFSTQSVAYYEFEKPGKYDVFMHSKIGDRKIVIKKTIQVSGVFPPVVDFQIENDPAINDPVLFDNTTEGAVSFFWNFGDGETSENLNPSHIFSSPGYYAISLSAVSAESCSSSVNREIYVACNRIIGHNLFTPNSDSKNDTFDFTMLSICEDVEISIFNRWGSRVFYSKDLGVPFTGTGLPDGVYYYHIKYKGGEESGTISLVR